MSHFDTTRNERYFNVKVKGIHSNLMTTIRKSNYYEEVPRVADVVNEAIEYFFKSKIARYVSEKDIPDISEAVKERKNRLGKPVRDSLQVA